MKKRIFVKLGMLAAVFLSISAWADVPAGIPGWHISGAGQKNFQAVRDEKIKHSGAASVRLEPKEGTSTAYGVLMQSFSARKYLKKRVRVSIYVKTEGRPDFFNLWARVQGGSSPSDGHGLGGGSLRLAPDKDWQVHEFVFDVPSEGLAIQFGAGLKGAGKLWIDDVVFEEVSQATPLNDGSSSEPENLNFEK